VDLKKEIKKLQRLRDQIKTWISSNDIKDKTALTNARKLIETKMEKFKVCEKETKTKTYSKEGLARAAVLDPEEQAKEDSRCFLQGSIDKLGVQIESFEADVERLSSGKGAKKNRAELEEKDAAIKKHRWHIGKMEQIIRMIDNDGEYLVDHVTSNRLKSLISQRLSKFAYPPAYWRAHSIIIFCSNNPLWKLGTCSQPWNPSVSRK
jgi:CCR4-NOT transcriptional regulation complex NOT5 subunit